MIEALPWIITIVFFAAYVGGMNIFQTCEEVDHDHHSTR